jgi:hypothetical protein
VSSEKEKRNREVVNFKNYHHRNSGLLALTNWRGETNSEHGMAAASTAADVPLGSSLIANGGPDTSAWNMFW